MLEFFKKIPIDKIISTAVLLALCLITVQILLFIFDKCVKKSKLDPIIRKILRISVKSVLLFTTIIIVLSSLGVSVSSLVATLSVVGVAVSLAIQGFLSNVFGGIQIISNQPFRIGDFVKAGEEAGTVREVGLFYTKLDTPDNKLIQIPNSIIATSNITNYSSATNRRVDITIGLSYDDDIEKVKSVLLELLMEHPSTIKDADLSPIVHVNGYNDNSISYTLRAWCKSQEYWDVYFDIMDSIKPRLDAHGISFSYPHVNLHMLEK